MKTKAKPIQIITRALWLAFKASTPMGMGFLYIRAADLTKEENMSELVQTTDTGFSAYTDYVAGRMMKTGFYVTSDGVLTISPDKPRFDYQSWIVKYPTPEKLIEAVYKSFE